MATIAVLGTLDTKGREHAFVAEAIRRRGHRAVLIDVGTGAPAAVAPDISREAVAAAAGIDLATLVAGGDRGRCIAAMAEAAFLRTLPDGTNAPVRYDFGPDPYAWFKKPGA